MQTGTDGDSTHNQMEHRIDDGLNTKPTATITWIGLKEKLLSRTIYLPLRVYVPIVVIIVAILIDYRRRG